MENLCPKKTRSGKFGGKYCINWIYIENSGDFSYVFGGGIITVTNAKSSDESEKFTLKIRSESGKLFTNGCHFAPKSTNFGTLHPVYLVIHKMGTLFYIIVIDC